MQSKAPYRPMATGTCLKRGSLGDVFLVQTNDGARIVRELRSARSGCRWIARRLARREARALIRAHGLDGIPNLIALEPDCLIRTAFEGQAMHRAPTPSAAYFRQALHLLRRLHGARVTHNDLAKEANWLCLPDGGPAMVDFQIAGVFRKRGRLFRLLAREDLRHLLKHKAHYQPNALSLRQRKLLANRSLPARALKLVFKPIYRLTTRKLLGWPERNGADERERPSSVELSDPSK